MQRCLLPLAFAAVVVPGVVHGLWTGRWGRSELLERFTARLADVPKEINDWKSEDQPVDERVLARADLSGVITRQYVHRSTRQPIMVLIACGRSGPVCVHTPDFCYENAGHRLISPERRQTFKSNSSKLEAEFKAANFVKTEATGEHFLQIYWAWSNDGVWQSPTVPRIAFGREPALYKLYVSYSYRDEAQRKELDSACRDFMNVFLPELQAALFEQPRRAGT